MDSSLGSQPAVRKLLGEIIGRPYSPDSQLTLDIPGKIACGQGWELSAEREMDGEKVRRQAWENGDPYTAWLDADVAEAPFTIRTRLPGDRMKPLGMNGLSMKLSDLMINNRLPRRARQGWPLVVAGNEIAWIPGFRLAHPFRVTGATGAGIKLTMTHINAGRDDLNSGAMRLYFDVHKKFGSDTILS